VLYIIVVMVFSKINGDVEYKETRKIDSEDKGHQSSLYEVRLFDKDIVICLGKPKYTFASRNIVFYPIYIVSLNDKIEGQIGVFELNQDKSLKIFDEEGDIDIIKLNAPLFYEFAERIVRRTKSDVSNYLLQWNKNQKNGQSDQENKLGQSDQENKLEQGQDEDDILKVKVPETENSEQVEKTKKILEKGIFIIDENETQPIVLSDETAKEADEIKKSYKESNKNPWIQKFMKNNNYKIIEVENNGDCFFAVIRDAFKQIGHLTTVAKLRAIVAQEATDQIFQEYREIYNGFQGQIKECELEMARIKKLLEKDLKKRAQTARDNKPELDAILAEVATLKKKYVELKSDKQEAETSSTQYVGHMKEIDTLEKFREYIQTSAYWADSWAISIIERVVLVKIIIFSEQSYTENSLDSVLNCGEIDPAIQTANTFTPNYYIMTTYSGNHYRLISYKSKQILRYSEIPYHVKILIVNKCLERNSGIYYLIQDFRNFKSTLGIAPDAGSPGVEPDEVVYGDLYDPEIVFMFHSKSEKTAKPGKGSNEKIPKAKSTEFIALSKIEDWRRKMDDSWDKAQFTIDKMKWISVEHYYQGSKFRKGFPDFYKQFSIESDSDISKDIELAKAAGSATGLIKKKGVKEPVIVRPKSIIIDSDFYGQKRNLVERELGVRSKFSQNEDLKQLLLSTKNAKLIHFVRGDGYETDEILMKIRKEL
jgi:predicted NAD-dependent protein-ADP-ribosyltransferase YbiA (DUF1768 family)